ncbi:hybrid sensor histidine kinase/response regulator [Xanthomonas campestris]|uniref:hybrid sensor histidine kinase/response regulator n=1 Tax=Xanthomonas campestris TaxID=339 RepID=UPI00279D110F|nr:response regulator [Xanthomonas campestris pv. campestris]WDJ15435.1 response regulator [Xanthomonas campestris pv. campestris]WDJ78059.1 response regulator [Xanthomonas campestris pv. campestris]WDK48435.1 response regulator [Xanthomonas campestris pv. campestris]WDK55309.1 response regulator [Xanthomonas campestris pv. campestris]
MLLLGLCVTVSPALATRAPVMPVPNQVTVADGLPSDVIGELAEDKQGYLWLASDDGLARFDGRNYRIWRMEEGLTGNAIWTICVDQDNRVWMGFENGGAGFLEAKTRTFKPLENAQFPELRQITVWSLAQTPNGDIWLGTAANGLYRRRPDGSMQQFLNVPGDSASLPADAVNALRVAPNGTLWIATPGGLVRWDGKQFTRVALPGSSQTVGRLRLERDGNTLWVTDGAGELFRLDAEGRFSPHPWQNMPADQRVYNVLLRDRRGRYWLDTNAGMALSETGTDVVRVPIYSFTAHSLVNRNWIDSYEDREGGLWFAALEGGLWHLLPHWDTFAVLAHRPKEPHSLANTSVLATVASASGGVWLVGSKGVLERLDPATGRLQTHLEHIDPLHPPDSVFEDTRGVVWIGVEGTLVRYDPRTRQVKRLPIRADVAPDAEGAADRPLWMAEDGQGQLWVSVLEYGLQLRDAQGSLVRTIVNGTHGLEPLTILDIGTGPDGQVWLSNNAGLRRWDPRADRFVPVPGAPSQATYVFRFAEGGVVWLGVVGEIRRYLWDGTQLKLLDTIGKDQEFPMVAPNGLVVHAGGVAWVSSQRGLIRIDPGSKLVRVYGVHDGLPNPLMINRTLVQATGGQIVGAAPDGVVVFDPTAMHPNTRRPPLLIERVGVRRGERGLDITGQEPLTILDDDRDLHIVARMPTFTHPDSSSYRFRLSGYDPDWIDVGPSGERLFSRLPPGDYTLEVQGRTADGIWSASQTLTFQVLPPWWRSPWGLVLLTLLALCVVVAVVLLYRRRLRRLNAWQLAVHKQELAEQASLAKTRFLATLGHEVRTPMTGVLGMSELLLKTQLDHKQRSYTESIRRAGSHLLRLVNDALDLARIESGRLELDLQPFSVRQLVAEVEALMAPLAQERGLRFSLEVGLLGDITASGDPTRIRQILLNLLSNAIKFTERGVVGLKLSTLGSYQGLRFEVADTGPGINADQKARLFQRFEQGDGAKTTSRYGGSGLGLAICQELAMAMGGHIEVISRLGAGTRFVVDLPLRWVASNAVLAGEVARDSANVAPLRILLVEDEPTIAEVIVGLLRAQGHSVVHAPHGLAALTEAADNAFDLALLDLDLPGLDGFALARQLRVFGYDMPLIAVTARSDEAAEPTAQQAGFDSFLRKPLTGDMLADTIAEALRRVRPREEL